MRQRRKYFEVLFVIGFGLVLLELLTRFNFVPSYLLPAPTAVFQSWIENFSDYRQAFVSTLVSSFLGLFLSGVLGILLALLFSISERVRRLVLPICVFFQTVPVIAIAPLLVIWFGFGQPTVVVSSMIVSFFPILANALLGLESVPVGQSELFYLMKATRIQKLFKLQLPFSVPHIIGGFQIATGLAVVGAIVGEFVGGGGLGGLIDSARTQQKIEMVFGAVILSSLLGLFLIECLKILSRTTLKKYLLP